MPLPRKDFTKKLNKAVTSLNKLKARFDSEIQGQSTPQAIVSIKEELDNAFSHVYNLCVRRNESLVESSRNNKEKYSLKTKVDQFDYQKGIYDAKYNAYLNSSVNQASAHSVPSKVLPAVEKTLDVKSVSNKSQFSTTSSVRAKLEKDLALQKLHAAAELEELENKRKEAEIKRRLEIAQLQYNYDMALARSASRSSKCSVTSEKLPPPAVPTVKSDPEEEKIPATVPQLPNTVPAVKSEYNDENVPEKTPQLRTTNIESFDQFISRYNQSTNQNEVLNQDFRKHHSTPHIAHTVNFDLGNEDMDESGTGVIKNSAMALLLRSCNEKPPDNKYNGSPLDFFMFMKKFEDTTLRLWSHDPRYCLQRLTESVDTKVYDSIKWCYTIDSKEEALATALDTIKSLYGDVNVIERAHIDNVVNGDPLKDNHESLFEFLIKLRNCRTVVLANNPTMKYGKSELMTGAFMRLPRFLKSKLNELLVKRHTKFNDVDLLSMLIELLDTRIKYHASFLGKLIADDSKKKGNNPVVPKKPKQQFNVNAFVTTPVKPKNDKAKNTSTGKTPKPCPMCSANDHSTSKCNVFIDMNSTQRVNFVKQKSLCDNCLKVGHLAVNCWSRYKCKNCNEKHHTLICPKPNAASVNVCDAVYSECNERISDFHVNNACSTGDSIERVSNVSFQLLNLLVWNNDHSKCENVVALMDGGSNVSLCTDRLYNKLGLNGKEANVRMKTLDGTVRDIVTKRTTFTVKGIHDHTVTKRLNDVLVVQALPDLSNTNGKRIDKAPAVFDGLPNFPTFSSPYDVDILIGACDADMHIMLEVKQAINNPYLYAIKLPLGWTRFGSNKSIPVNLPTNSTVNANVNCAKITNADLHQQMEKVFNFDFIDAPDSHKNATSINDDIASNIVQSSIRKVNGRYEIAMPFKPGITALPNNYVMAHRNLLSLTKRLLKGPEIYCKLYNEAIEDLLSSSHAVPVDINIPMTPLGWYLPHFYVLTCSKFRMVFNPSATFCGFSLNDSLFSGPDINNTLIGVLLRFRQHPFAFVADLQKMFHQVSVPEYQQDSLRFLWWKDGKLGGEVAVYRMTRYPFGIGPAPFCANSAVEQTAKDNEPGVPQHVCNVVFYNRYVDDILKSCPNESMLVSVAQSLITLFKSGKFCLRKFMSNSKLLLSKLPAELLATSMKEIALHGLPIKAVLGVSWDPEKDNFVVRINIKGKPRTRRGLLSQIGEMFSPLGMLGPFILPMKVLLQDLQVLKYSWDDEVPQKIFKVWKRWLDGLPELEDLALPRAYSYYTDVISIELHCFSDASTKGYSSCCYLRYKFQDRYEVSLVFGKCRVVPKRKGLTVPRLELQAAVVSVRLASMLSQELDLSVISTTFWTDSTTVLKFIANSDARYKVFIANRVKFIREHTTVERWRYIPTKLNPADIGSRGVMPHEKHKVDRWLNGPKFLEVDEEQWDLKPASPDPDEIQVAINNEVVVEDIVVDTVRINTFIKLLQRYSTWNRLRKAVVWLERFKRWWIATKIKKEGGVGVAYLRENPISVEEMEKATVDICRIFQHHAFPGFNSSVKTDGFLKAIQKYPDFGKLQCQSLKKLHPFVSDDGLLRVGGRIHNSRFSDEVKHPIILPARHHVTSIIINHEHQKYAHFGGYRYVLGRIRTNFWIVNGTSAIKHYLKSCRLCQQLKAKPLEQVIAPLPADRLLPGRKVFHASACDYFGPIPVLLKRSVVKRWCCLFTCLATRAIHIEVVYSLSTDSFIKAYLRFLYLVGFSVQTLYSDNASCFHGANVELRDALAKLNHAKIHSSLRTHGVNWIFNPPAASHQGGVYERQIRSVRKIFRVRQVQSLNSKFTRVVNQSSVRLDDEDLITLIREAQTIVNARPITPVSDDPDDFSVITPLMLLTGCISPEPPIGEFSSKDELRKSWKRTQSLADKFWDIWVTDYIPSLQKAHKWHKPARNLRPGDLVLYRSDELPKRRIYPLAVVQSVDFNSDGYVRRANIRLSDGKRLYRDIRKLSLLEAAD